MQQNFQQSSMYRSYHSHIIPSYLHDRPKSVIIHCLDRRTNSSKFLADNIHYVDSVFEVEKTSGSKHRVDFGISSSEQMLLALANIGLDTTYHANIFFCHLHPPISMAMEQTPSYKVHISPQTPKHSKTTFIRPLTIEKICQSQIQRHTPRLRAVPLQLICKYTQECVN